MRPAALILLALLLLPRAVAAQADSEDARAWEGRRVEDLVLALDGAAASSPAERAEVRALLDGAASGLALAGERRLLGRRRPDLDAGLLAADRRRLRLQLAREGFPAARLRATFAPRGGEGVAITIHVDPGPMVRVAAVELDGLPEAERTRADSLVAARVLGRRFAEERVRELGVELGALLRERGYAELRLATTTMPLDSVRVALRVAIEPGARYRVAAVAVRGVTPDLARVAARRLDTLPGRLYSPSLLRQAQIELRKLQLFRRIDLESEPAGGDSLRVVAALAARKPRSTRASVGTWSDHPFRLRASWEHRNLFGGGRGLRLRGAWSPEQQLAALGFWWPERPRPRMLSAIGLKWEAEREESYRQDTASVEASLLITPWRPLPEEWRPALDLAWVNVDDLSSDTAAFEAGAGHLLSLSLEHRRDRSDDLLDPRHGLRLFGRGEFSPPGALSDYPYLRGDLEATAYRPLARATVAGRAGIALATPLGSATQLLPSRRLYAGGSSSMRGYRRRQLGPLDAEEGPLGGRARALASLELRVPLVGRLGAAFFGDAGQVWSASRQMSLDTMALALGGGLMIATPVGVVRGDVAVNQRDAPDHWLFHFSVGHPW